MVACPLKQSETNAHSIKHTSKKNIATNVGLSAETIENHAHSIKNTQQIATIIEQLMVACLLKQSKNQAHSIRNTTETRTKTHIKQLMVACLLTIKKTWIKHQRHKNTHTHAYSN